MVTVTVSVAGAAPLKITPDGTAGFVGPKPVPNSSKISPGLAGRVVTAEPNNPGGPRNVAVPSAFATKAATYFRAAGSNMKNPGDSLMSCVTWALLVPLELVTVTLIEPSLGSSGAWKLIWLG